jgi:predicted RNA-binding protein Jag
MVEDLPAPESRKKVGVTAAEMEHALAFVTTLLANMQIDARAVALPCPEGEEYEITDDANIYPAMEIVGDGTGILIGHHGETLDAIQYLLNLAAIRHSDNPAGDYVKISLDIENYRAKREETLRSLARRMAARALKYKRNVFLEPMNAYERRIIHSELQNVENVSTHSVGTDKNRKIIITYEGPDKVFDDRRRVGSDRPEGSENRRRDHGRNRKPKNAAPAAEAAEAADVTEAAETTEKPQGEHKSRNRNRNRNRNRRRQNGEGAPAEAAEQPLSAGAAAIMSGAEKEAFDRQLSDPTVGGRRPQQEISLEDLPSFQQKSSEEK